MKVFGTEQEDPSSIDMRMEGNGMYLRKWENGCQKRFNHLVALDMVKDVLPKFIIEIFRGIEESLWQICRRSRVMKIVKKDQPSLACHELLWLLKTRKSSKWSQPWTLSQNLTFDLPYKTGSWQPTNYNIWSCHKENIMKDWCMFW